MNGKVPLDAVVSRIIRLLQFVASRRFGALTTEISEEMGVSKRQVYRYMHSLKAAGVRVVCFKSFEQYGRKTRWKIVDQQEFFRKIGIL